MQHAFLMRCGIITAFPLFFIAPRKFISCRISHPIMIRDGMKSCAPRFSDVMGPITGSLGELWGNIGNKGHSSVRNLGYAA